jgi:hypothetical protein
MYALFIGGIIFVALSFLIRRTNGNVAASRRKTSWDNVEKRQRDIQRTKEKVAHWGFPIV